MSDSAPSPSLPLAAAGPSILLSRSPSSFSSSPSSSSPVVPQTYKGGILRQPTPSYASQGPSSISTTAGRIKFAPLPPPPTPPPGRRNSISVGVAARGQILRSQGATGKKANNNGVSIYISLVHRIQDSGREEAGKVSNNEAQADPSSVLFVLSFSFFFLLFFFSLVGDLRSYDRRGVGSLQGKVQQRTRNPVSFRVLPSLRTAQAHETPSLLLSPTLFVSPYFSAQFFLSSSSSLSRPSFSAAPKSPTSAPSP